MQKYCHDYAQTCHSFPFFVFTLNNLKQHMKVILNYCCSKGLTTR